MGRKRLSPERVLTGAEREARHRARLAADAARRASEATRLRRALEWVLLADQLADAHEVASEALRGEKAI
jgi:hypothetical protein